MEYNRFFPYKILRYDKRLKQIANGDIPYPVMLHIYMTNACTNNCDFCIMKTEQEHVGILSLDVLKKVLLEASEVGVEAVHFSGGGEPTLNIHLAEAAKIAQGYGMKTILSTNGSYYNNEIGEYMNHIRVSVNAGIEETYNSIMKPHGHTFRDVINNTISFMKDKKDGDTVGMGFVITPENYNDVYAFCKEASEAGIDFVHIRPAFLEYRDFEVQQAVKVSSEQIEQAKKDFTNLEIYAVSNKFDGFWTPKQYTKCRSTPLIAVLTATGEYTVCQDVFHKFGNAYTQSIKEIWGSEEHKAAMNKICLEKCPRCVETKINEIIENVYINDKVIKELI